MRSRRWIEGHASLQSDLSNRQHPSTFVKVRVSCRVECFRLNLQDRSRSELTMLS